MQDCSTEHTAPTVVKLAYSKIEAAKLISVSVRTIDNLIAMKEITVRRIGRRVLVPHTSITAFLRRDHDTMLAKVA